MSDVVPLRYGTAFKKAFSDPEVLSGFVRDVIGVNLHFTKVDQEKAFSPPVGKIDVRFDLYAEDTEHRAIVELQHVRTAGRSGFSSTVSSSSTQGRSRRPPQPP